MCITWGTCHLLPYDLGLMIWVLPYDLGLMLGAGGAADVMFTEQGFPFSKGRDLGFYSDIPAEDGEGPSPCLAPSPA